MSEKCMIPVTEIVDFSQLKNYSLVLYDPRYIQAEDMVKAFDAAPPEATNVTAIAVTDLTQPLVTILSEADLNAHGWHRR